MNRSVLPLACIVATTLIAVAPALACPCPALTRDEAIARLPVVFDGEAVRVETDSASLRKVASFRVRGTIKGVSPRAILTFGTVMRRLPMRTITVLSPVGDAACGYDFAAGPQRLTVGAERAGDGTLVTTSCLMAALNRPWNEK